MASSNTNPIKTIKAYFRLPTKYAKIVYLQSTTSTDELYLFASQNYNIPIQDIHLFYQGLLLPTSTTVNLQENGIIHIVRLNTLAKDTINISIKMIGTTQHISKVQIECNTIIRRFLQDKLCPTFSVTISQVLLVYLGKQLKLSNSFKQQQVQDGAEILCLFLQNKNAQVEHNKIERSDSGYKIKIPIQRLQTPQPPKDIYLKSDFTINIPQGIHTSNNLNLIFDSKVKRSSSIQNVELHPEEIIPQEESNFSADFVKASHSCQSERGVQSKQRESCFSQEWNKSPKQSSIKRSYLQQPKMIDFKNNDVIYAANFHILKDSNAMGDLINQYKEKLKLKIDGYERKD